MDEAEEELLSLPASGSSIFGSEVDFEPEDEGSTVSESEGFSGNLGTPPMAVSSSDSPLETAPKDSNPSLGAAISLFTITSGGVLGYRYGEWKGATGGVLLAGGARNLWRARGQIGSTDLGTKGSGIQQGIIGLAGLAAGAYLLLDKETT